VQLTPRYDGPPLLELAGAVGDPSVPLLRQRRRLGDLLQRLDDQQWAAPTRCEGWSVQDVVLHLNSTNGFWAVSFAKGLAGEPTRYLTGFDPVATPAQLVDGERGSPPALALEAYLAGVDALAELVGDLDDDAWERTAEAPPGHVTARAVALHALWDAWVHERDIALPLGLPVPEEPDEILGSLRYGAGLGPAFRASVGDDRTGSYLVEVQDPDARLLVELGPTVVVRDAADGSAPLTLRGRAVDVLEALSQRLPHDPPVPREHAWMLTGLAEVFDQT
jgi:uncharacterized protein (TIGR03083 family)